MPFSIVICLGRCVLVPKECMLVTLPTPDMIWLILVPELASSRSILWLCTYKCDAQGGGGGRDSLGILTCYPGSLAPSSDTQWLLFHVTWNNNPWVGEFWHQNQYKKVLAPGVFVFLFWHVHLAPGREFWQQIVSMPENWGRYIEKCINKSN